MCIAAKADFYRGGAVGGGHVPDHEHVARGLLALWQRQLGEPEPLGHADARHAGLEAGRDPELGAAAHAPPHDPGPDAPLDGQEPDAPPSTRRRSARLLAGTPTRTSRICVPDNLVRGGGGGGAAAIVIVRGYGGLHAFYAHWRGRKPGHVVALRLEMSLATADVVFGRVLAVNEPHDGGQSHRPR
ncbi:hypothetical protein PWT90_00540 [Aphanocladium album]|nr:hypothetical protein PWT90_00540 [Aphanocladium album]